MRYYFSKISRPSFISALFVIIIMIINVVMLPVYSHGYSYGESEQPTIAYSESDTYSESDAYSESEQPSITYSESERPSITTPESEEPPIGTTTESAITTSSTIDLDKSSPTVSSPAMSSLMQSFKNSSTSLSSAKAPRAPFECDTAQQLADAIESGETNIKLTQEIVFDNSCPGMIDPLNHSETITIDGNGFSIIAKTTVVIPPNVRFVGNYEDSTLLISDGGDFFYEDGLDIDISGDNATAFLIKNNNYVYGVGSLKEAIHITLSGNNSTGIHYEGYSSGYIWFPPSFIEIRNVEILTEGSNCTGIKYEDARIPVLVILSGIDASVPVDSATQIYQYGSKFTSNTVHIDNDLDVMMPTHFDPRLGNRYNCAMYGFYVNEGASLDETEYGLSNMIYTIHKETGDSLDTMVPVYPSIGVNMDNVDVSTPGKYLAEVTPTLPVPGLSFSNFQSGKKYKIPIYVMENNKPYLAYAARSWGDSLQIKPLLTLDEDDEYILHYRKGDEDWQTYATDDANVSFYYMTEESALIQINGIDFDADYEFRLEVLNGDFAGETNVLKLYGGMNYYKGGIGGDWDGDDQLGQTGPPPSENNDPDDNKPTDPDPIVDKPTIPNTQNKIDNESEIENTNRNLGQYGSANEQTPKNHSDSQHSKTGKPITLTTSEIKDILKKNNDLVFIKNGIKVIVPESLLKKISIHNSKTFGVDMDMTDDGFYIDFFKDGKELTDINASQYTAHVPYQYPKDMKQRDDKSIDKSKVSCQKGTRNWPALEVKNNLIEFRLDDIGSFTLSRDTDSMVPIGNITKSTKSPTSGSTNNINQTQAVLAFVAFMLLIAAISTFVYRKRVRSV